jgi:AcrR family transcriptional regulator
MAEDVRARVCEALVDLVLERGYAQTTIADVVTRAGVERPEFDRLFADKEACFMQAYRTYFVDVLEPKVFAAYEAHDNWRDSLRAAAYQAARFVRDHPRAARFGSIEMLQVGPLAQAHREAQLHRMVDLIDAGRQELDDPDSVGRAAAEATFGSIYAISLRRIEEGDTDDVDSFVPELMYVAVRPYLGHEIAQEELTIPPPPEDEPGSL